MTEPEPQPEPEQPAEAKPTLTQRGAARVDRAKERAAELRAKAEEQRSRSAPVDVALGAVEHDAEVGGGILAGAVAFRIFLLIVPLVFFFVYAFGLVSEVSGGTPSDMAESAGIAGLIASTIDSAGEQTLWSRITICAVSGFALILGARSMMKVLNVMHVLVWRLPRTKLRHQVSGVAGLIFSVAIGFALVHVTTRLRDVSFAGWVAAEVLYVAFPFAVWLVGTMHLFPHPPELRWIDVVPGALLVGVGVEVLKIFTVLWTTGSFERRSETYGAIGGSLALLLWAYVAGRIFTAAVVLNAVIWRRNQSGTAAPPSLETSVFAPPPAGGRATFATLPPPAPSESAPDLPLPVGPDEPT